MPHLLHLDASANLSHSRTRKLTAEFAVLWSRKFPTDKVTYRDLAREILPPVDEAWISAAYKPADQQTAADKKALAISDKLVDEFLAADTYVFGVPMYNLGITASFKLYVDQIIRAGRTLGEHGKPVVVNKRLLFITSRGGHYRPGTPTAAFDHQVPYLSGVFGMIGVKNISFINVEGQSPTAPIDDTQLDAARGEMKQLLSTW